MSAIYRGSFWTQHMPASHMDGLFVIVGGGVCVWGGVYVGVWGCGWGCVGCVWGVYGVYGDVSGSVCGGVCECEWDVCECG